MNFSKLVRPTLVGLFACLFVISTQAQNKTVTGKVTDSKDGSAMAGASVVLKGTKTATQTGADGTFRLSVPTSATTLVISSVGFGTKEVSIQGTTNVEVSLTATNEQLGEVVVVGYGTARRKDLTGAVVSVQAKNFNQGAINAPDQLLQSKVAGLEVTNQNGQPGAAATIQIRGTSSIRSNNNPLYVVDGVPLDGGTARPNIGNTFGSTPSSNPLLFIDPNSIAQMDVLKDASSAAIYGARGANGVIMITTKKATAGPLKLEVGSNWGSNIGYMKRFEILDASGYRAALKKFSQPATLDGGANVDALKEITQNTLSQNYSLAMSGGSDNSRFRAGFLASNNKGYLKKSSLEKYLATLAGGFKFLDKKLSLDFNIITGNYAELLTSVSNNAGSTGNIISSALSWNPTVSLRNANGTYNFPANGSGNPLAFNDAYSDIASVFSFLGSMSASYKITDELEYKILFGINHGRGTRAINLEGWLQGFPGASGQGIGAIANATLNSQTITHTINWRHTFNKNLSMEALAGYEYFKTNFSGNNVTASGFNTNLDETKRTSVRYTDIMTDAKNQVPFSSFKNPQAEIQSEFARLNLNYKDKLLLTGTIRADGSSKFGKNNRYGYFPSLGGKWAISNESFMSNNKMFSNLALRASWGITGNQEYPAGSAQDQYIFDAYNNSRQNVIGNPNLKWEKTRSIDIGLEFTSKNGKVFGSVDYYHKKTSDVLLQNNAIAPAPSGVYFLNLPGANIINKGIELSLGATLVNHQNFGWDLSLNWANNQNKVVNLKDPNTGLDIKINTATISGQGVSGTLAQVMTNNQPLNVYYLKPFLGFDATGNQQIGGTEQFAGDPNPHNIFGMTNTLRYHKFNLVVNLGGASDFLIYNNSATAVTNLAGLAQGRNVDKASVNSGEGVGSGVAASTRFLEKGDYLKLRNVTLRYDFGSWGKYIKNLSGFVSATNLFVITKFTGFDPEVNIDKTNNSYPSRSIEYVPYPTPRTISFGFNFNL